MKVAPKLSKAELVEMYRQMQLIRTFEEESGRQYMRGKIRGFLHLYIGEEAIAVGAIPVLKPQDYVFTHYRDHGHALARGMDPNVVMAELFGKSGGSSKGKGGSMHLFDVARGFMGGYAIVGGQVPLATGAAFGAKYKGADSIVLCFLGDGALNEGEFYESVNIAAIWKLPIIFFCENNLYGMGSPVKDVFAVKEIHQVVEPFGFPSKQLDGMDVLAVHETMERAEEHVRGGNGPYFLEALTYRFRGHSIADPAEYRHKDEEAYWKARDPIVTFHARLLADWGVNAKELDAVDDEVNALVEESVKFADESPVPEETDLYKDITA